MNYRPKKQKKHKSHKSHTKNINHINHISHMKNIEEFVKNNVKIEYVREAGEYGYFPFHCFVEKADGHFDFIVIAGVESVGECYKLMSMYVANRAKRVYMAIDYPAFGDIETDFVAVFETTPSERKFNVFAIPYNPQDGTIYERIPICNTLKMIVKELSDTATRFALEQNFSQN